MPMIALWPGAVSSTFASSYAIRRNVDRGVPVTAVQQGPDGPYAFVSATRTVQKRAPQGRCACNKTTAIIDGGFTSPASRS